MTAIRSRTRAMQVTDDADPVTDGMRKAAREFYEANKAKNAAASDERKAQKKLDELIAKATEGKAMEFVHVVGDVTLDVKYAMGKREVIDVAKMYGMVDKDTFLATVTASKKAVKDNCGANIEAACTDVVDGDWKASVKARK